MKRPTRLRLSGIAAAVVLAGASPAMADLPNRAGGTCDVVFYWGVDAGGNFFQTEPLDADNPANVNVVDPQHTLPIDASVEPTVTKPDGTTATGDAARQVLKTDSTSESKTVAPAAAGGFVCSPYVSGISKDGNYLTGTAEQTCTGSYLRHWIEVQIQREYAWYQVSYSPWRTWSSTIATSYTWNLLGDCATDGTTRQGNLRWNVRPHGQSTDGTNVTGGAVYGTAKLFNCGWGITQ